MKITAISDIHGSLLSDLPSGDTLTISGDICPVRGSHNPINQCFWINNHFLPWCVSLINNGTYKHVVFTPGNHDFVFQKYHKKKDFTLPENVHRLQDSLVEIEGVTFYGTPWSPTFCDWAFMKDDNKLDNLFRKIPEGIDVLLCHSPAFGFGDKVLEWDTLTSVGSKSLLKHVLRSSPKYLCVGHIHSGDHNPLIIESINRTTSVNVSVVNQYYKVYYKPFEFEV
jgi:Icc-related predicted phosphoesterase